MRSPTRPVLHISDDPYRDQPSASTSTSFRAPSSPRIRQFGSSPAPSTAALDRKPPSPSSVYFPPSTGSRRMHAGLPLGGHAKSGWIASRLRGHRVRWIALFGCVCFVVVWSKSRAGPERSNQATQLRQLEESLLHPPPAVPDLPRPIPEPAPLRPPPIPRPKVELLPIAVPLSPSDDSPIDVPVRPSPSVPSSVRTNERYLAYSPHSGYHNQRISLENALTLAYLLDRTLLLPPVWLGHAIPYISFDKLQRRLEMATKAGLEQRCTPFGETDATEDPIPRECQGFWDWTLVDWDFLVDIDQVQNLVPIKRRTENLSTDWIERELDLVKRGKHDRGDTYSLKDDTMYQYRFYDSRDDLEPLDKWKNRIDIDEFERDTRDYKLVHVGTMFGTNKLRTTTDRAFDARSKFRRAMVFRNEPVDLVTEEIRDQLGGAGKYYGLHLRVGDGVFQKNARENMKGVWDKLCLDKMQLDRDLCDEMRSRSSSEPSHEIVRQKRDQGPTLSKRANSRPQREGAYHHAPLPPLPTIRTLADSPITRSLACRKPLHTASHLLPFNAPLYIATDSKLPRQDPNLALFFDAFPCTFTLSDFSTLDSLDRMNRLRNQEDKTPLAQFLYPQLDAQVAAWGRAIVGTPQSTYSSFAVDVLHQTYHGWDIVERG
ncbi:uncharacterized protein JCM15063_005612 [Sporobolomyces koalae]|uniref:uncharacterized protein n=1 Tax=Sporobolomyces koalae TaxID=500713 RepID=UPI003170A339